MRGHPKQKRGVQPSAAGVCAPRASRLEGLHCSMQKGSYSPSINVLSLLLLLWPLAGTEDAFAALLSRGEAAGKGGAALREPWLFPDWLLLWHQRHLKVTWAAAEWLRCGAGMLQSSGSLRPERLQTALSSQPLSRSVQRTEGTRGPPAGVTGGWGSLQG